MRPQHLLLLFAPLLLLECNGAPPLAGQQRVWSRCETLVKLQDKRINESSGIAASRIKDDVYYTHNDSGDSARFFRFDRKGQVLDVMSVVNAKNAVDWEDMASATINGKPYLFFGDIGDNSGIRKEIYVYRVPEPTDSAASVEADRTYVLRYPDGPHNAEALMVDPATGDIYVVTKAATKPSIVFKLSGPKASGSYVMKKVGELEFHDPIREGRMVTAGDISPNGKQVVLRTYLAAYEYDVPGVFDDWIKSPPRRIQINFEFQGEGICYGRDGTTLLTTSEGTPCLVSEARLER